MSRYYVDMDELKVESAAIKKITDEEILGKIEQILRCVNAINWSSVTREAYEENLKTKMAKLNDMHKTIRFYAYFLEIVANNYSNVNQKLDKKFDDLKAETFDDLFSDVYADGGEVVNGV